MRDWDLNMSDLEQLPNREDERHQELLPISEYLERSGIPNSVHNSTIVVNWDMTITVLRCQANVVCKTPRHVSTIFDLHDPNSLHRIAEFVRDELKRYNLVRQSQKFKDLADRLSDVLETTESKLASLPGKKPVSVVKNHRRVSFCKHLGKWRLLYDPNGHKGDNMRPVTELNVTDKTIAATIVPHLINGFVEELIILNDRMDDGHNCLADIVSDAVEGNFDDAE